MISVGKGKVEIVLGSRDHLRTSEDLDLGGLGPFLRAGPHGGNHVISDGAALGHLAYTAVARRALFERDAKGK